MAVAPIDLSVPAVRRPRQRVTPHKPTVLRSLAFVEVHQRLSAPQLRTGVQDAADVA
ncbi:hypothetical protein N7U49_18510 [Streptomyces sp. AD2-2]|nr:hypothetical protein N7U49_18510 [Streptomyces sp. AD2-2]